MRRETYPGPWLPEPVLAEATPETADPLHHQQLTRQFITACTSGDLNQLVGTLADDVTFWGDGGGKAAFSAPHPLIGAERVAAFIIGVLRSVPGTLRTHQTTVNGQPGFGLSTAPDGYRHTVSNTTELVDAFIDRLRLNDVTLLAHDTGGPIGLGALAQRPDLFRAIIPLDTFCFPVKSIKMLAGMLRLVSSRFPGALLVDYFNLIVNSIGSHA